jgi:multidrug resistance efflux pump
MPDDVSFRQEAEPGASPQPGTIASGKTWWARRTKTERGLAIAGALALMALTIGASNWWTHGRFVQTTDNAYIRADISVIAARVGGYVESVDVADNQVVAAGDPLLHLEAADYEAAAAQARANLSRAEAEFASIGAQRALASSDVARYRPLARRGILSPAGMQEIEARAAQMGGSAAASPRSPPPNSISSAPWCAPRSRAWWATGRCAWASSCSRARR